MTNRYTMASRFHCLKKLAGPPCTEFLAFMKLSTFCAQTSKISRVLLSKLAHKYFKTSYFSFVFQLCLFHIPYLPHSSLSILFIFHTRLFLYSIFSALRVKNVCKCIICLPTEHQGTRTCSEIPVHSRMELEFGNIGF